VTCVQDQDTLLDYAEELEYFPYGFLLWDSAIGLARMLAGDPALVAGKRVLELGAGVGLPGIVARSLGADVCQTDHQMHALWLAQVNACENGVEGITTFAADWQTWTHPHRYDVVLGADILYERGMHFYLEDVFGRVVAPGGKLLLSDPGRPQAMEFAAQLETRGWTLALDTQSVLRDEGTQISKPVEVLLLTATRTFR
jgi:predicted nicotinamide N-methyase